MIAEVQWKVCGLTSLADVQAAVAAGADLVAFNFYPQSPRYVTHAQYQAMDPLLPKWPRVAVSVEPELSEVQWLMAQGFDYYQIHFLAEVSIERVAAWSELITPKKLWLAPKLPPGTPLPTALLPFARTFLLDTFATDKFGGTGKTGDWGNFHELQAAYPDKTWILSGGLSPANIGAALQATGARFVDVNSGVESKPGVKDPAKMTAFAAAIASALGATRSTSDPA